VPRSLDTEDGASSDGGDPPQASMVSVAARARNTRRCCGTDTPDRGAIATVESFTVHLPAISAQRDACDLRGASGVPAIGGHGTLAGKIWNRQRVNIIAATLRVS
jgi:hypothetical protein